jgi:chaperonin GroES
VKADNFLAIGDRVLVKPDVVEERTTEAGIVLPEVAQDKPLTGVIVSVGEGVEETQLRGGVKVLYSKYGGVPVEFDEGPHLMLRESEVLGVCL